MKTVAMIVADLRHLMMTQVEPGLECSAGPGVQSGVRIPQFRSAPDTPDRAGPCRSMAWSAAPGVQRTQFRAGRDARRHGFVTAIFRRRHTWRHGGNGPIESPRGDLIIRPESPAGRLGYPAPRRKAAQHPHPDLAEKGRDRPLPSRRSTEKAGMPLGSRLGAMVASHIG